MIEFVKNTNCEYVILLVHGLTGGKEAWLKSENEKSFAQYLKEDDVTNRFDIATFDYFTAITDLMENVGWLYNLMGKHKKIKKNLTITQLSNQLKSQIDIKLEKYDGIVFIAHSMGGLICKNYILDNENHKAILFISLAVPHNGSSLADIGKRLVDNPQIMDLAPLGRHINDLNRRWIKSKFLPLTIYHLGLYDKIVPETSAVGYESRDVKVIHSDHDHSSIIRPESSDDTVIQSILKQLKMILTIPKKDMEIISRSTNMGLKLYNDPSLGFKLNLPKDIILKKPQFLSYKELIAKLGGSEFVNEDTLDRMKMRNPFGRMLTNSKCIIFELGQELRVDFLENSSSDGIEENIDRMIKYAEFNNEDKLSEDELDQIRKRMIQGRSELKGLNFPIMLGISILNKTDVFSRVTKPNLPNLLRMLLPTSAESIDELEQSKNKKSVIWNTRMKLLNVKIDNIVKDFTFHRVNRLIEARDSIYFLQVQWSPDSQSTVKVFNQLEMMLNSFKVDSFESIPE